MNTKKKKSKKKTKKKESKKKLQQVKTTRTDVWPVEFADDDRFTYED